MITKMFEVRDAGTFIPCVGVKMAPECEAERYLLRRTGFGFDSPLIMLMRADGGECHYDCHDWGKDGTRTMYVAHQFIEEAFDSLASGAVIDVEFILKERDTIKVSEALGFPL